jgi:NADPH:quinone reductase-like Zn-dependent oxidoreductase
VRLTRVTGPSTGRRSGGPEVLDIVDVPEPTPGPGQQLYDVTTPGLNFADTHHSPF